MDIDGLDILSEEDVNTKGPRGRKYKKNQDSN
jgi:hypothetical protein